MSLFGKAQKCAVGVVFCLLLSGCFPPGDNMDEKKDPNFITGKNLISQMDWNGAIEAFEKALDSNPRSASAHFELGWLYGEKATERDLAAAAAIYHYQRFLKLDPSSDKADVVRQFINTYKLELVKSVSAVGPMASGAQRELERVLAENKDLQGQIAQLQSQVTQLKMTAQVNANRPQVSSEPVTPLPPPVRADPIPVPVRSGSATTRTEVPRSTTGPTSTQSSGRSAGSRTARTHVVKSRETMASIARQYGISLAALQSANPGARPTHLVVGQTLKIPAP